MARVPGRNLRREQLRRKGAGGGPAYAGRAALSADMATLAALPARAELPTCAHTMTPCRRACPAGRCALRKPEKTPLEKFRTRWRRWLGNKTRADEPHWTTLLDSNWLGWVDKVFSANGFDYHGITFRSGREEVKAAYGRAIDHATMDQLRALDGLYAAALFDARNR